MFEEEGIEFQVVANHEEQYSVWPTFKEVPAGWMAVGPTGTKDACLDYIERVWTDMRPKSLRDALAAGSTPSAEASEDVRRAVAALLEERSGHVAEYGAGKPELYGWFVSQALARLGDHQSADVARAALDALLPEHVIPAHYA